MAVRALPPEDEESQHRCGSDDDCKDEGPFTKCGCAGDDCGICVEPGESRLAIEGKNDN